MAIYRRSDPRARIALAHSHRLLVDGLRSVLEQDYEIAWTARSDDELLSLLVLHSPDCLLLDLLLPGACGMELVPRVRDASSSTRILVISEYRDRPLANAALSAGAHGFLPTEASSEELRDAIAAVLAGSRYLSPLVPKTSHRLAGCARHPALGRLTQREQEVLLLLGSGSSQSEIARALHLSKSTVTFHKNNLCRTLGLTSGDVMRRFAVLLAATVDEPDGTKRAGSERGRSRE